MCSSVDCRSGPKGRSLEEIAITMGWGIRHAGNIIEKYTALVPEKPDDVLLKLAKARREAKIKVMSRNCVGWFGAVSYTHLTLPTIYSV